MKKECVTKHKSKKGKTKFLFLNCFLYVIGKLRQYIIIFTKKKNLTRPQVPCSQSLSSGHDVYNMYMHELNVRSFRKVVQILMFSYHIHTHAIVFQSKYGKKR
jgi:hypothetical protein